ncbi:MAG: hypothetical protein COB61_006800 [Thiotrichales bacterium]|nr:hypothetical protein [Thiotrichales bacterium]
MSFLRGFSMAIFLILLAACGGGGGGSSSSFSSAPANTLSGQVLAPSGALVLLQDRNIGDELLDIFLPAVLADFTGVLAVTDATVELVRLNLTGSVDSVIATTTSNGSGAYSFNLTSLGVSPGTTLAVRVASGFLRAFVTGTDIDITVESETVFRRVVAEVGGINQLTNYTVGEIDALVSGLRRVTSGTVSGGGNINDAVMDATQDLSVNNTDLNNFANSAATAGEEISGPGDNNYIVNGVVTFNGSVSVGGGASTAYTNQITTNNAAAVQGIATQELASNNFLGEGGFSLRLANTLTGIVDYTDVVSGESTEPTPILFFPFVANESTTLFNTLDIDGESFQVTYQSFTEGLLTVPAGTFNNVVRVRISAMSNSTVNNTIVDYYFAANRGLVRQDISASVSGIPLTASEEAASGIAP